MGSFAPQQRRILRAGLAVMAVTPAAVGTWATLAPRGFYDDFPVVGQSWVSLVGAYDEHLVRDVGALYLGALVLIGFAWKWLEPRLVQATLVSYAVAAVPHLVYHCTALDGFTTLDGVAEIAGLALNVAVPIGMLFVTRSRARAG